MTCNRAALYEVAGDSSNGNSRELARQDENPHVNSHKSKDEDPVSGKKPHNESTGGPCHHLFVGAPLHQINTRARV